MSLHLIIISLLIKKNMIGYEVKKMDLQEEIKEGPSIWKNCKDHQDHDDEDDYFAKSL